MISSTDLFNDIDGTQAMKYWIGKKEASYIEPTIKGVKITNIKLNKKQYLEILFYSILRLADNMLRLRGEYHRSLTCNMCKNFKKHFLIKLKEFPLEVFYYKNKLRKQHVFTRDEIKVIKSKSLDFIFECESYLKKYKKIKET